MTPLTTTVRFLGPPEIQTEGGAPEPIPGLVAAVGAYLLLSPGAVSRRHLATLFWPGTDRSRGFQSVRQTLARLRRRLGPEVIAGSDPVEWSRSGAAVDVLRFRDAVQECEVEKALSLWRGPLLQGFRRPGCWELEDWLERERTRLRSTLVALVRRRARDLLKLNRREQAVDMVRAGLERVGPIDRLAVLEVELLAAAGRGAEAEGALAALDPEVDDELRARAVDAVRSLPAPLPPAQWAPAERGALPLDPSTQPARPGAATVPRDDWNAQHARAIYTGRRAERLRSVLSWGVAVIAALLLSLWWGVRHSEAATWWLGRSYDDLAVLFCSDRATNGQARQLFRMSLDGTNKHRITQDAACGVWSTPEGTLLGLVYAGPDSLDRKLARYRLSKGNELAEWEREWIAPELAAPLLEAGAFRAIDGSLVVSAMDRRGQWDLYRIFADGDSVMRLTDDQAIERYATVDPAKRDGPVVYTRYPHVVGDAAEGEEPRGDLYLVAADGGLPMRLTSHPMSDHLPAIHGDSVVFVRGLGTGAEDGMMELVLLDLRTGTEEQLTRNGWNDYLPRWSADGRRICWQSEELGHYEMNIAVMDLRTRKTRVLVDSRGRDSNCFWAPDGRAVLFTAWGSGNPDIHLVPARGGPPVALTVDPGGDGAFASFVRIGTGR